MKIRGSELCDKLQNEAKARFVHRLTKDNPVGLRLQPNVNPTVIFKSDNEWLAHTFFEITKRGQLSNKVHYCTSGVPPGYKPQVFASPALITVLKEELEALEVWKGAPGLPEDVREGIEISISKIELTLTATKLRKGYAIR
jgi:hypothetical protein